MANVYEIAMRIVLVIFSLVFFGISCGLTQFDTLGFKQYTYQNVHALEYPTATSDLAARTFRTPALPMRLASAWEIQDIFGLANDALSSPYSMVYRLIGDSKDMKGIFTYKNALQDKQKQWYCPKRKESQADWQIRTEQQQINVNDIAAMYQEQNEFNVNSEHADFCRTDRAASMMLAHVATRTFTLFSSQNSIIMLMFAATVNTIFSFAILLYKWHAATMMKKFETHDKMCFASVFSILIFVASMLSGIPLLVDYMDRKDTKIADYFKYDDNKNMQRAVGSYVLGVWTIVFSFVYMWIMPQMNVMLNYALQSTDAESATPADTTIQETEKGVLAEFFARQPMITLAYWNLLTTPLLVMVVLTSNAYGIDVYTQFIMFGAVAIGVLDIVQARVNMIASITARINKDRVHWSFPVFLFFVFACLKLAIAVPIFVKLEEAGISPAGFIVVVFAFMGQLIQNLALVISNLAMAKIVYNTPDELTKDNPKQNFDVGLFELSLAMHILWSLVTFASASLMRRISA